EQVAAFQDENIVAGAFRNVAFGIEHDGFFAPAIDRFDLGQHVVEVIQGFDGGIERAVQVAHGGDRDDFQTSRVHLGGIKLDFVGDDDDRRFLTPERAEAKGTNASGHY